MIDHHLTPDIKRPAPAENANLPLSQSDGGPRPSIDSTSNESMLDAADGLVQWLRSCPEQDWLEPIASESTDSL